MIFRFCGKKTTVFFKKNKLYCTKNGAGWFRQIFLFKHKWFFRFQLNFQGCRNEHIVPEANKNLPSVSLTVGIFFGFHGQMAKATFGALITRMAVLSWFCVFSVFCFGWKGDSKVCKKKSMIYHPKSKKINEIPSKIHQILSKIHQDPNFCWKTSPRSAQKKHHRQFLLPATWTPTWRTPQGRVRPELRPATGFVRECWDP